MTLRLKNPEPLLTLHEINNQDVLGIRCCPACEHNGGTRWLKAPDRFHGRPRLYELMRCPSCSLVWLNNPPPADQMDGHYGPDYHRLVAAAGESSPKRWREYRRTLAQYKRCGAVLDLGCGTGSFLTSLKDQGWKLYGIEISEPSAEKARARSGAQVFIGDILEAPFPPESMDVVTSFDVLEHLYGPREAMEKVWRWLKPGGIFYVVIPNIQSWEARLFRSYWWGLELPRHLYHFSPESLERLLLSTGFRKERSVTPPINYFEYSAHYVFDRILSALGFSRPPLATRKTPSIFWRIVRKAIRVTILDLLGRIASMSGTGPSIEAIYRKDGRPQSAKQE